MRPSWIKDKTIAKDFEEIDALQTHPVRDFVMDPTGYYVLIKILHTEQKIAIAICNARHEIVTVFKGKTPRDLWTAIFKFEEKNKLIWFSRKDHIAYLGKELKKAQTALTSVDETYVQE